MIIGIDGNEANVEKRVGIGEYAFELLEQFSEFKIQNSRLDSAKRAEFRIYLKEPPRNELPKEDESWEYRIVKPKRFWTQIGLPLDLYLHKPRPDVFFTPTHYSPRFSPVPTVISIMDLSYIHFPEMFAKKDLYQLRNWTSYSAKKAKKILTISKASKDDIIKTYGLPENRVMVTYPGIKQALSNGHGALNMEEIKKKYGISSNYILFVGTLQPRKNIVKLIEAFSKISNLTLLIVGKKGWMYEEILEAPIKFGVEKNVKFLEFVSNDELKTLYKNALCFVLPSLYEGFGLPILEAMVNGCPVLTSNVSSLPEAGGDAALYFDPKNPKDIASKIQRVIEDKKLRTEMIKKGYDQARKFSWEKTARETLDVLGKVAAQK
ncbi:MAG: glycosyltransferase family 4 protein [Patescibacteria group bacterium]|nr:glycosyltransferase family 4 protein [Patescibacteria group bacterium]